MCMKKHNILQICRLYINRLYIIKDNMIELLVIKLLGGINETNSGGKKQRLYYGYN